MFFDRGTYHYEHDPLVIVLNPIQRDTKVLVFHYHDSADQHRHCVDYFHIYRCLTPLIQVDPLGPRGTTSPLAPRVLPHILYYRCLNCGVIREGISAICFFGNAKAGWMNLQLDSQVVQPLVELSVRERAFEIIIQLTKFLCATH